ncbi:M20 aminoacylase family protein [Paraburkholderia sp. CNPSo 3272]|uniref:M20 aminoacylase family protein n=1 Tax=Paraburkholderia sp. CNPSo 3272 TaxID=2940931 RepID=UPI0035CCE4DB
MVALRRQLHAQPELGFEEHVTSALVAEKLEAWGYRVTRGVGGTGVVATLVRGSGFSLGLRADMDALPLSEATGLPYASGNEGVMHACGHDGHTAILLAAARCLAQTTQWRGTLHLIFQPAEEGLGGARRMIEDGLFERFPCDAVFAMHNVPGFPAGRIGFHSGAFMASADEVTIRVIGRGGHAAAPQQTIDPVVVGASIVMALQSVVARNVAPHDQAVVTVGALHAGSASNVIAAHADLHLSVRALSSPVRELLERRIREVAQGQAASYGARVEIDYRHDYPVLVNHSDETEVARRVALEWGGPEMLIDGLRPLMASEDFAYMLERCPGSYLSIGNGDGAQHCSLHSPGYDFNDASLAIGASYWVKLAEHILQ